MQGPDERRKANEAALWPILLIRIHTAQCQLGRKTKSKRESPTLQDSLMKLSLPRHRDDHAFPLETMQSISLQKRMRDADCVKTRLTFRSNVDCDLCSRSDRDPHETWERNVDREIGRVCGRTGAA